MTVRHVAISSSACLAVATIAVLTTAGTVSAGPPSTAVAWPRAGADDRVPVVVLMDEFPDSRDLLREVRGMNRAARRAHVVATRKSLAERSQREVRAALATAREDEVRGVRVLWGVNGIALDATPALIERLERFPGVARVVVDGGRGRPATDALASAVPAAGSSPVVLGTGPTGGDISGPNPDATVRGEVVAMGAKQVWDELGYTGAGVIVAVIDTGVDPTHPDLADHLWTNRGEIAGNGVDDDGNGHVDDTWGWDFCEDDNVPFSGNHGTQAAGQIAGDGTNGVVTGMAPDAELMVIGIDCNPPDSIGWQASEYAIENGARHHHGVVHLAVAGGHPGFRGLAAAGGHRTCGRGHPRDGGRQRRRRPDARDPLQRLDSRQHPPAVVAPGPGDRRRGVVDRDGRQHRVADRRHRGVVVARTVGVGRDHAPHRPDLPVAVDARMVRRARPSSWRSP